jgi:hypothetical protein
VGAFLDARDGPVSGGRGWQTAGQRMRPACSQRVRGYHRLVHDEPTNAAAEISRHGVEMLNDEAYMRRDGLAFVTPDFVRYDRRRLSPQPPADRGAWRAAVISFADVSGGWPAFSFGPVVAVRGERLAVYRLLVRFGDDSELEFLVLSRLDEELERSDLVIFFDREDNDEAMAELDRLHAEITQGEGETPTR